MLDKKHSLLPTGSGQRLAAETGVFTFRVLQVTEAVAFGVGARTCVSLFGEVFQRTDDTASGARRICSGRVEFDPSEREDGPVGRFSFPDDVDVQPFFLAYVDVKPSVMTGLIQTLRSGPGVELAFRADIKIPLAELVSKELALKPERRGGVFDLRTVSVSVSR